MIKYRGEDYVLYTTPHNKTVSGYLCDGVYRLSKPKHAKYRGYIQYGETVIEIYVTSIRGLVRLVLIVGICVLAYHGLHSTHDTVYYKVSFAESPKYVDGMLYCTVVNVSNREIVVRFVNEEEESIAALLQPGDTLPYIELNFVPTHIVYDDKYPFKLEVQYE